MTDKIDLRPKCYRCEFLCLADYGYSDYTTEGTDVICLHGAFDNREQASNHLPSEMAQLVDEYGLLEAASMKCGKYREGIPLALNVDCDQQAAKKARLNGDKKAEAQALLL